MGEDPLAFPKDALGVFGVGVGLQATVVPQASDLIDSDHPSGGPADRNSWYVSASRPPPQKKKTEPTKAK